MFKKVVLKDETTSKANSDLGYSSSSEPSSPQLERNHLLETPQTPSCQSSDFRKEIEKKDKKIKELEELLNKKNAVLSKIKKEKNEAFDRASKNAQELERTKDN
ncbi:MAG: hypothetical protein LKM45_00215 [Wolbachia endosymbiont of Alcedoecus sp.]|nr:hypothetical protein [Wolbachia endosymbiont of Alcedoecus sp.]